FFERERYRNDEHPHLVADRNIHVFQLVDHVRAGGLARLDMRMGHVESRLGAPHHDLGIELDDLFAERSASGIGQCTGTALLQDHYVEMLLYSQLARLETVLHIVVCQRWSTDGR